MAQEGNLYVCGLPLDMDDAGLAQLFQEFGQLESARVCQPKPGGMLAYGFVKYFNGEHAAAAMEKMNGQPLGEGTLQVRIASGYKHGGGKGAGGAGTNVYVCGLPTDVTEDGVKAMFNPFGSITGTKICPSKIPGAPAYAFVDFATSDAASQAISTMNNVMHMGITMQVRLSNSETGFSDQ
eukprot:CAMPEP_0197910662 /NCGR_PEP_ID=MMETSP1439-20131203/71318_1 /TAXON_ID=66791 /ORGANISM="Gonyaulax spinifera, Strain CCMP409" /LENGTH=180 /DNA_ID=CAMNT_0043532341 /DNA_START=82 /DNA_END=621 /DNA_ORIENTATION=+